MGLRSRYRKAREEGSGNSPRASMGFSKPRIGFSRDWEIYRDEDKSISDERRPACSNMPASHRSEFLPGYSSAGCFPAEPASASPDEEMESGIFGTVKLASIPLPLPTRCRENRNGSPGQTALDGGARVEHFRTYPDSVHWPRRRGDSPGGICSRARSQSMLQAARTRWYSECGTALATRERTRDAGWRSGRR